MRWRCCRRGCLNAKLRSERTARWVIGRLTSSRNARVCLGMGRHIRLLLLLLLPLLIFLLRKLR
jgi:hypothetical protein